MKLAHVMTNKEKITYHADPLHLYQQLTHNAPHTLLLESAEIDSKDHLKSMVRTHGAIMIRCDGYQLTFTALTDNGEQLLKPIQVFFADAHSELRERTLTLTLAKESGILDEDARLKSISSLDGLRTLIKEIDCGKTLAFEDLFLGGVLAYDLIDTIEPLPTVPQGKNTCPDYLFYLAETLIIIDHQQQQAKDLHGHIIFLLQTNFSVKRSHYSSYSYC